jgi:signal transduction histidine kinase
MLINESFHVELMNTSSSSSWATPETLAAFFSEMRDDVMSRWAKQVTSEIAVAAGLDSPVLVNTLPILYDDIAEAVSPGVERPFATSRSNLARMHGQERARMTNYGPGDVVHELQLFRDVIFRALKSKDVNLGVHECEIIGKSIDIATREAISGYSLVIAKMNETFIASLSHDLRNPLHVANCIAQLMQMKWSDPDLISMAKRVCNKLRDVDEMIQTLLDASLLKTHMKLKLHIDSFDILRLAEEVCADLPSLGARINVVGKSIDGHWCRTSMKRVLENLLSNAHKYGDPEGAVTVEVNSFDGRMMLSVHNEGSPIPEAELQRLFQPFERMENVSIQGWGLGLPFVQSVAESHGGTVVADSAKDRGTTFTVSVPIDARPYAPTN